MQKLEPMTNWNLADFSLLDPCYRSSAHAFVTASSPQDPFLCRTSEFSQSRCDQRVVFVSQGEYAVSSPIDEIGNHALSVLGSDDATTCLIVCIFDSESGACGVAHVDSVARARNLHVLQNCILKRRATSNGEARADPPLLSLFLAGGIPDDCESISICTAVLDFAARNCSVGYQLELAVVADFNVEFAASESFPGSVSPQSHEPQITPAHSINVNDLVTSAPAIRGLGFRLAPGKNPEVFHASFSDDDRGPLFALRTLRSMFDDDNTSLTCIYDSLDEYNVSHEFPSTPVSVVAKVPVISVSPFVWPRKGDKYARSLRALDDDELISYTSSSPLLEQARFCADIRGALELASKHSNGEHFFRQGCISSCTSRVDHCSSRCREK